mmetsp:Transcript_37221/g.88885  ORF Transcript_37221/g.88885 Transcript_37221/m.88885 type:complete len:220 (-) Transcript_37221:1873-2532(-)
MAMRPLCQSSTVMPACLRPRATRATPSPAASRRCRTRRAPAAWAPPGTPSPRAPSAPPSAWEVTLHQWQSSLAAQRCSHPRPSSVAQILAPCQRRPTARAMAVRACRARWLLRVRLARPSAAMATLRRWRSLSASLARSRPTATFVRKMTVQLSQASRTRRPWLAKREPPFPAARLALPGATLGTAHPKHPWPVGEENWSQAASSARRIPATCRTWPTR